MILKDINNKLANYSNMAFKGTLIKVGAPAVEPVINLLNDKQNCATAIRIFGEIGYSRASDALISVMDTKFTRSIVTALGWIGDPAIAPLQIAAPRNYPYLLISLTF